MCADPDVFGEKECELLKLCESGLVEVRARCAALGDSSAIVSFLPPLSAHAQTILKCGLEFLYLVFADDSASNNKPFELVLADLRRNTSPDLPTAASAPSSPTFKGSGARAALHQLFRSGAVHRTMDSHRSRDVATAATAADSAGAGAALRTATGGSARPLVLREVVIPSTITADQLSQTFSSHTARSGSGLLSVFSQNQDAMRVFFRLHELLWRLGLFVQLCESAESLSQRAGDLLLLLTSGSATPSTARAQAPAASCCSSSSSNAASSASSTAAASSSSLALASSAAASPAPGSSVAANMAYGKQLLASIEECVVSLSDTACHYYFTTAKPNKAWVRRRHESRTAHKRLIEQCRLATQLMDSIVLRSHRRSHDHISAANQELSQYLHLSTQFVASSSPVLSPARASSVVAESKLSRPLPSLSSLSSASETEQPIAHSPVPAGRFVSFCFNSCRSLLTY